LARTAPAFQGKSEIIWNSGKREDGGTLSMPAFFELAAHTITCAGNVHLKKAVTVPFVKNAIPIARIFRKKSADGWINRLTSATDALTKAYAPLKNVTTMPVMLIGSIMKFFPNAGLESLIQKKKSSAWILSYPLLSGRDSPSTISVQTIGIPLW